MSERETIFVEVIIPIAIPRLLTYRIPFDLNHEVVIGKRVVVQLGKSKLYTAIISSITHKAPENQVAKYIETILDANPVVTKKQIEFWKWIADYYLCSMGEVASAALPGSLKLASETKVVIREEAEINDKDLTDKEFLVLEALEIQEALSIKEITEITQQKSVVRIINALIKKGYITTEEDLKNKYTPKKEALVSLKQTYKDEEELEHLVNELESRAPKQMEAILSYLRLSQDSGEEKVSKLAIQKEIKGDSSLMKRMAEKGIFEITFRDKSRIPRYAGKLQERFELSSAQETALKEIEKHHESKDMVLLHGVTGSGKTEVYVRMIDEMIRQGKQILYLLPEIALTTQLITRLQKYYGDRIGVFHSKFNPQERAEVWLRMASPDKSFDIIIGARSSIFLPFQNLGLVIVDEEHEPSFKQFDPAPRYHARDSSVILARLHGAKVLLGSATPSIEVYWNAQEGRVGLVELNERFGKVQLPEILCSDVKRELQKKTMRSHFSSFLIEHIDDSIKEGRQIILFQNRRGYSPLFQCKTCGDVPQCERCDVSLTYHKFANHLNCHYCGFTIPIPNKCNVCGSSEIKSQGFGTEKIEEELALMYPDLKIKRMDWDTTRSKNAYVRLITEFENQEIDVLVGTQMISKGLDFENVGLVGILNADQIINFPDFRSFERSYQLMTQVAGRAGRKGKRGKVIIQTFTPDHWVIQKVIQGDYMSLFNQEILERMNFHYPPFYRLIKLTLKHKEEGRVRGGSVALSRLLMKKFGNRVIGPEAPIVARINNQFLRNILVKIEREASIAKAKGSLLEIIDEFNTTSEHRSIRIKIDVDPL